MGEFNEYKKMLVEFIYGEITPESERKFLEHLSICEECQRDLREIREAREILRDMEKEKEYPPPVVIVEGKERIPWAAAIFLFLFFMFILGFKIKIGDNQIQVSAVESQDIYEYLADVSEKGINFAPTLKDYENYFNEINQGGKK
ncbi:MAG: zf-HC2 domain-containing protein [Candidatus Aminicenantes bacterium]|nr:zf-HC2 domain-containing protein [Candidatus Aminicenantes bacterium]